MTRAVPLFLTLCAFLPTAAWAQTSAKPAAAAPVKKKTKKQLKADEELKKAQEKAAAEAKQAEEAAKAAEEAKKAEEAKQAEEARLAAIKTASEAQAASMQAQQEAEAKELARKAEEAKLADDAKKAEDAAKAQAASPPTPSESVTEKSSGELTKESFYVRGQIGTELFSVPYLFLNGIPASQRRGAALAYGAGIGLRLGITRLGVEYQRTHLPQAAAFNKFLLNADFVIPIWRLDFYVRVAAGYSNLQAPPRALHGGAAKLGAGVDFRIHQYFSAGVGGEADGVLQFLGLLPQLSVGGTIALRLTATI